jgi:hypothetical protein
MIEVYATEQRTLWRSGKPPMTIVREVAMKNGLGTKTVKVFRGKRVISKETERLNGRETRKIGKRRYIKKLYKPMERRTLKKLNA